MKKPGVKAALALLLAGGAPIVLELLGVRFMPSDAYLHAVNRPALVFSLALAAIVARQLVRLEPSSGTNQPSRTRRGTLFLLFTGLLFVTGYLSVAVTLPMTAALISNSNTSQHVMAGKQPAGFQRGCRSQVKLAYPHFLYNTLCGVRSDVQRGIARGDTLTLTGRGNSAGIYYTSVVTSVRGK